MSERGDVVEFVKGLLPKVLKPPDLDFKIDIKIERAHRSLQVKPTSPEAPLPINHREIRRRCSKVHCTVLQQAWSQGQVMFQNKRMFFDQDYSPELQKKQAKVHAVAARLKLKLDSRKKKIHSEGVWSPGAVWREGVH